MCGITRINRKATVHRLRPSSWGTSSTRTARIVTGIGGCRREVERRILLAQEPEVGRRAEPYRRYIACILASPLASDR